MNSPARQVLELTGREDAGEQDDHEDDQGNGTSSGRETGTSPRATTETPCDALARVRRKLDTPAMGRLQSVLYQPGRLVVGGVHVVRLSGKQLLNVFGQVRQRHLRVKNGIVRVPHAHRRDRAVRVGDLDQLNVESVLQIAYALDGHAVLAHKNTLQPAP